MKPILFSKTEENFNTLGYGALNECTSCYCEEERNGIFEVTFKYPTSGLLYNNIEEGCYIKVKPNEKQDQQIFKIYGSSKVINGDQEFYCEHVSYKLNKIPLVGVTITNKNAQQAMQQLKNGSLIYNDFTFFSDIDSNLSTTINKPVSVRKALGGVDGSILDTWGGEFEWDNFKVYLKKNRGKIVNIPIKYGLNLKTLNKKKYIDEVYNAVLPYVTYSNENNETAVITLSEKYLVYSEVSDINLNVYIKDFSDLYGQDEVKSEDTLREKCTQWMKQNKLYLPSQNITVDIVKLEQTTQYRDLKKIETLNLCDYVPVIFEDLKADNVMQVIRIKYDCILERNEVIELGDEIVTLNGQVQQLGISASTIVTKVTQDVDNKISNSVNSATGNNGGHIVLYPSPVPEELLIMDTDNINTAVNVIKGNQKGIGHSGNGYKGSYKSLISIDGKIAGFSTDEDGIYTDDIRINKNGDIKCYSWADLFIIDMIVKGTVQKTQEMINRYDFNNDNNITIEDYNILKTRLEKL